MTSKLHAIAQGAWGPRTRKSTPGPEQDLLDAAFACFDWRGATPVVFREPRMPTGFPDIVAVILRDKELLFTPARSHLRQEHLRLLHHIYVMGRASENRLATSLMLRPAQLSKLVADLESAELIRRSGTRVIARSLASAFVARRIFAVEAKIHDWHRAVDQAIANTWFASHSYVLLPERVWSKALRDHAGRHGVGVIVCDGTRTSLRLAARELPLPASYGSWLVNEWAFRQVGRPAPQ